MIFYDGPSKIDGQPIIGILIDGSKNRKTGDMAQTYILRKDMNPVEAIKSGQDKSICGNCVHRGNTDGKNISGRSCYVTVFQGPFAVYDAYKRKKYPKYDDKKCREMLAGKMLRMGSYGDPSAIPVHVWERLMKYAKGHTSYSHRWQHSKIINSRFKKFSMASVDSEEEAKKAILNGWRYFRVRPKESQVLDSEIICPASEEAGKRVTCDKCRLCAGTSRKAKNITIIAHGVTGTKSNAEKNLIKISFKKLKSQTE